MIFITGDTHMPLDMEKLSFERFPIQDELTKQDYVIVCGDFGGIWDGGKHDAECLRNLEGRSFTTLFIDGNHENFDLLNAFPVESWSGGKIHRINDSVLHLMRGQVFRLENKDNSIFFLARRFTKKWGTLTYQSLLKIIVDYIIYQDVESDKNGANWKRLDHNS